MNNYKKYIEYILSVSRFHPAPKDFTQEELDFREKVKTFFSEFKGIKEDLNAIEENYEYYVHWENTLKDLFNFINSNYLKSSALSFSDLEYYTYKGLKSGVSLDKIQEMFTYFIVDEFQDTSPVQFEILKMLIADNFKNIFCVGDKKQAIYGFRGGELAVFNQCSFLMNENGRLSLKSNYRSKENIVLFNNDFYSHVLPAGPKFEGEDYHSVEMEAQFSPIISEFKGDVVSLNVDYELESSEVEEIDIDFLEAKSIWDIIKEDLSNSEIKEIAILYRKLRPSKYLIDILRSEKVAFSAQIKIKYEDDPALTLFYHVITYIINFDDILKRNVSSFHIQSVLTLLEVKGFKQESLLLLKDDYHSLGITVSFWKWFYKLGLSNALHSDNFSLIESIISIAENEILKIHQILHNENGEYSSEMISGAKSKITIMSTHSSKGLEFDSVILGGVHTNGRYEGLKSKVGKLPKSFKWKKDYNQKKYFKSLAYFLESDLSSRKEFSESKRLFYVATTRAIKKLSWVNLSVNSNLQAKYPNSWINALRRFHSDHITVEQLNHKVLLKRNIDLSLLQKDNLGILPTQAERSLGVVSELSVTRLSALALCPFKFYLKNICKIEEKINWYFEEEDEEENEEENEKVDKMFFSSKERGTQIHLELSKIAFNKKDPKDEIGIWVKDQIRNFSPSKIISEEEFKFSFFGQMITAVPDLILIKDDKIAIWDYKTGQRDEATEDQYWFQLYAYAFGYLVINNGLSHLELEVSIMYLDQKDKISRIITLQDVEVFLFNIWKKTERLSQKNISHCSSCNYNKLCSNT